MQFEPGTRLTRTSVTGTVLDPESKEAKLFRAAQPLYDGRHYTYVKNDANGDIELFYTPESGRNDKQFTVAQPKNWPPKNGDMWAAADGHWYAKTVDTGSRKALRMVHYTDLGDVIRSAAAFLKNHPTAKLQYRAKAHNVSR